MHEGKSCAAGRRGVIQTQAAYGSGAVEGVNHNQQRLEGGTAQCSGGIKKKKKKKMLAGEVLARQQCYIHIPACRL